jgi:hypothetical protein
MEPSTESNLFELQLDHEATGYLGETARWAKFFAILGFIFCGIVALCAISGKTSFTNSFHSPDETSITYTYSNSIFASIIFFIMAVIYFFPSLYMFRYASKMKTALKNNDQLLLNQSLRNLKSWFRFTGILIIVSIGLMLLGVILAVIGTAFH